VDEILGLMSEAQREFMIEKMKQGKKSKWLEALARYKGVAISEEMSLEEISEQVNDWVLVDVLDGGRYCRPYQCECGKSLRHQYIVHHREKGVTYKLGQVCFEHYTKLPPEVLKNIRDGFYHIDLERDEILGKYYSGIRDDLGAWRDLDLPDEIWEQVGLGLPLSSKQIKWMESLRERKVKKREWEKPYETVRNRLSAVEDRLTLEQKEWLGRFSRLERIEILKKIGTGGRNKYGIEELQRIGIDEAIVRHVELGLPLLESQVFEIERRRGRRG
jgi:hypothetical protein